MDGTLIYLDEAPLDDAVPYFSRKTRYALSLLVVCDDKRRIIYIHGPWPGSAHDNRIWRNCKVNVKKNEFSQNENIYWVIAHFLRHLSWFNPSRKTPEQNALSNEHEFFNTKLASPRVLSEHCIGILKNRFPCLKTINVRIRGREQLKEVMDLVEGCYVLHNILIKDDNIPQEWIDTIEEQTNWDICGSFESVADVEGSRRDSIFHYIIETFYSIKMRIDLKKSDPTLSKDEIDILLPLP